MFELHFTPQADEDIAYFKKTGNKAAMNKLKVLLFELMEHPTTGTGKPEMLKGNLSGLYSRRIDKKNRLIYSINGDKLLVVIVAAAGHYENIKKSKKTTNREK
ncbi:MAG: Txe/YoeB family addiction module toxin [Prevotellaceae bacterium]|jgi:toxin YoeB|nr:Txe/YoeB family addiction module toxin [Prevotellaceae bacterium]